LEEFEKSNTPTGGRGTAGKKVVKREEIKKEEKKITVMPVPGGRTGGKNAPGKKKKEDYGMRKVLSGSCGVYSYDQKGVGSVKCSKGEKVRVATANERELEEAGKRTYRG